MALTGIFTLAVAATGCQPPSETTRRDHGSTDTSGYALVHASAPGDNHHWNIDVTLRSAPVGTYALLFTTNEPTTAQRGWFAIAANDPALSCAAGMAHSKGCKLADRGDVVAVTRVGPGGQGVLRAAFDIGPGGWFSVVRVGAADAAAAAAAGSASFDVQVVSEALAKDEEPHRFAIELVR